jgi:hypothetical protein
MFITRCRAVIYGRFLSYDLAIGDFLIKDHEITH